MKNPVRCPNCGFIQEEANFCRECGSSLQFAEKVEWVAPEPVRYPWALFFLFFAGALLLSGVLGLTGARRETIQAGLIGIVVASAVWTTLDAKRKGVPRPWLWGLAVWLFWLVAFPWYLRRRESPERPCLLDSPRNRREAALVGVTVIVLTFFLFALARFMARFAAP